MEMALSYRMTNDVCYKFADMQVSDARKNADGSGSTYRRIACG
jgi:hypothetical protein